MPASPSPQSTTPTPSEPAYTPQQSYQTPVSEPAASEPPAVQPGGPAPGPQSAYPEYPPAGGGLNLRERARTQGIDVSDFQSEEEFADALIGAGQWYTENEPLVRYGRQYVDHAAEFERWQQEQQRQQAQQRQQQQQQAAQPKMPEGWMELPEYNSEWEQHTVWDSRSRQWIPNPQNPYASPRAAQERNGYERALRANQNILFRQFPQVARQVIEPHVQQMIDQRVEAALAYYDQISRNRARLQERAKDFYQTDAKGNVLPLNPQTGEPPLSPLGQAMYAYAQQAQQAGMAPHLVWDYAEKCARWDLANRQELPVPGAQQQQAPPQPGPGQPADDRERFMDRLRNRGNGQGVPPNEPRNPDATLRELHDEELRKHGLLPQTG